jgi:hypothetical protein
MIVHRARSKGNTAAEQSVGTSMNQPMEMTYAMVRTRCAGIETSESTWTMRRARERTARMRVMDRSSVIR